MDKIRVRLSILLLFAATIIGNAQVKISDLGNSAPGANSLLELESNNKGLLIPQMPINNLSLASPLTAPVPEGMLVFSIGGSVPDGFYYWNGSQWILLQAPALPLSIANGGTGSTTQNFVDLTSNQSIAGIKSWNGTDTFKAGLNVSGGIINLNVNSNFSTNLNSGTSTGSLTLGNTNNTAALTLNAGTGGINLNTAAATNETNTLGTTGSAVFASSTTGSDKLAILPQSTTLGTPNTGTLTTADLTAARTWTLPDASGTLLTSSSFNGWLLGGNAPGAASVLGTTDNSALTIQTGTGALNVGTDASAKTLTVGNAVGTTAVTINSGTGGIALSTGTATNETNTLGTTGSAVYASSTTGSDKIAILPQSTTLGTPNTGTITSADLTAARTWTLPDASGTLLTSSTFNGWLLGGNAPGAALRIGDNR